jgi:hypothetical protein
MKIGNQKFDTLDRKLFKTHPALKLKVSNNQVSGKSFLTSTCGGPASKSASAAGLPGLPGAAGLFGAACLLFFPDPEFGVVDLLEFGE